MTPSNATLSKRGEAFATPTSKMPMLDVVNDLWHPETNPDGYISLGVAENTLMHKELIEHITQNFSLDSHALTAGDGFIGSHRLRNTLARFINRHFSPFVDITKDQVIVTSGVGQAIELSGFALCEKGDGVLLARPHYGNFPIDLGYRVEAKIIGVSFGDVDPFSIETVTHYEKALEEAERQGIRVRVFLLCNPHNPLGRCYTPDVLKAYMQLCQKHNLHLISDEVYALSVWKNPDAPNAPEFTSALAINPDGLIDRDLLHVLWGMGKDFGSCGIRIGCLTSRNEAFLRACEANSYFSGPSSLADLATARVLADDTFIESYIKTNRLRLAENYRLTTKFLKGHQIPYKRGSNAGLFVWADLFQPLRAQLDATLQKQKDQEGDPEKALRALEASLQETLLKHKIFLALGADFGSDVPGWFRIVFAHEKTYLNLGLERMIEAIEAFRGQVEENKM
ncbi:1-aminocyclopropane-1-carboxylate synthase [Fusarium pseudoanthophilum]|uniref:1-aminocyclopropane-1-carboxylate synthase n=1 Tax=Fusarium pseudoanthophilum TaxID=48495 RepID=A0A8H5PL41_9HYPO|nr:1-aminocyclopropane-1-carboxylate synthase [Fusarium pseudoanthophilum]